MKMFPVGTRIIHIESEIEGTVVENYKFPNDICVNWDNGLQSSYDLDFLQEIAKELNGTTSSKN